MPLSSDEAARRRQLANLRVGDGAPEGNGYARKHGGYATIVRDRLQAREREVFEALAADAPLQEHGELPVADAAVVSLLAQALCRLDDVSAHVRDFGMFDQETGQVRPAVELEARLRREVHDLAESLGMTPRSRARLGVDVQRASGALDPAAAIAAAREEHDPQVRRAILRRAGIEVDDG